MLGEFFAAPAAESDERLVEAGPQGRFPTVEAKGLSHVPIARLGTLLGAGPYDVLMEAFAVQPSAGGHAVLFRLPRAIRDALAEAEDIDETAGAWAATEELSASGWTPELANELMGRLAELARSARAAEMELWYWWSL